MTPEEKQLLLKDLCARLPYETWVQYDGKEWLVTGYGHGRVSLLPSVFSSVGGPCPLVEEIKPYLRPMSSMTEKEMEHLESICDGFESDDDGNLFHTMFILVNGKPVKINMKAIDWLNAHHFDYRIDPCTDKTLIESGLAIEAPEGMYKDIHTV